MPIIPALERLKQKGDEFEVSLGYIARSCLKTRKEGRDEGRERERERETKKQRKTEGILTPRPVLYLKIYFNNSPSVFMDSMLANLSTHKLYTQFQN
jgi:hypothetical protein